MTSTNIDLVTRRKKKKRKTGNEVGKGIELNLIEVNGIWVRALPGLMHLGLTTGPLCHMFYT
jgi:hypothetical protein